MLMRFDELQTNRPSQTPSIGTASAGGLILHRQGKLKGPQVLLGGDPLPKRKKVLETLSLVDNSG